jgi:signal transduction histidine kinase
MLDDGTPAREGTDPFAPLALPRGRGPLVGAGVSLQVCGQIAARHGGSASLITRPDGATLVTLRLPAPA